MRGSSGSATRPRAILKRLALGSSALVLAVVAAAIWFATSPGSQLTHSHSAPPVTPGTGPSASHGQAIRDTGPHSHGRPAGVPDAAPAGNAGSASLAGPAPTRPLASPGFVPDQADLQAALLTAAELPGSGYTVAPSGSAVGLGSLKTCPALSAGESGVSAEVSVAFMGGNEGPEISEGLFQDTVTGAQQMLAAFSTVASTCGSFSVPVDGLSLAVTVTTATFPPVGDQTAAVQVTVTVDLAIGNVTITGDVEAVRHGGTVIVVTNVAYPAADQGLTQSIAAAAYAKVASRW